jgi:hypothetical protein
MPEVDQPSSVLDRVLDPLTQCFTPEVARRIATMQADRALQRRLDELAEKSAEGSLSPAEIEEYRAYVEALDLVGILQAKARAVLNASAAT